MNQMLHTHFPVPTQGGAAAPPYHPPIFGDHPPIVIDKVDNGYIVNYARIKMVYKDLFQVSKWLRAKAMEEKNIENHQTL